MQKGERAVRILPVEDDMELCRLMGFWLEEKGYLADICQDSQEAFYYLGMQAYNVVILDRMLPGMNTDFAAHETEGDGDTGYYGDGSRHHRRQNRRSGCGGR